MSFADARRCVTIKKRGERAGERCKNPAIEGAAVCRSHGGNIPNVRARAAVRAEVERWALTDVHKDPGEVLLRLVSQSANRVELYSGLLAEAYDAAERLKVAHDARELLVSAEDGDESAAVQKARADLDRIFNTGGVAALVGHTYATTQGGDLYATGEHIRGLAELEAKERDRCAGFATKAVAAGLAKRQVELAERQGAVLLQILTAVFDELGLSDDQLEVAPDVIRRHLNLIAG